MYMMTKHAVPADQINSATRDANAARNDKNQTWEEERT